VVVLSPEKKKRKKRAAKNLKKTYPKPSEEKSGRKNLFPLKK
jgi:lauroyl/myristoyl acyltransferase